MGKCSGVEFPLPSDYNQTTNESLTVKSEEMKIAIGLFVMAALAFYSSVESKAIRQLVKTDVHMSGNRQGGKGGEDGDVARKAVPQLPGQRGDPCCNYDCFCY